MSVVPNAAAVSRIGVCHLDDLNSGAARAVNSVGRHASGGAVGSVMSAIAPSASTSGSASFNITIEGGAGGNYTPQDLARLKTVIKGWRGEVVDKKMKGQRGYAWQQKYGSVGCTSMA
jgi:hypothetical protein